MTTKVVLPKLGFSMNEGTVTEWLVGDGEEVAAGQPLYSLESDKSVHEIESPATGKLKIIAAAGQTYRAGEVLAEIE